MNLSRWDSQKLRATIAPTKYNCSRCGVRKAKFFCDRPESRTLSNWQTCDAPLCDYCGVHYGGMHFCPPCIALAAPEIIQPERQYKEVKLI